ncbi:hypothetical protein X777_02238 [Ooceraea biroi]|uniref:Uncharacterized protein n=1 Tax=Ooceraea biroi TaxID=2015173 RepID=A0A026WNH4_OOCBI|nr:hypothetical protein X777_02238 [Ooceraea biroi]
MAVVLTVEIGASPMGTARTMVSEMRTTDLVSSASGYAYSQRGGLPVSYVRYTNHGSGRYYRAPAPVHYVVDADGPAPVAPVAVSETASPHETGTPYATARHEIIQPYPRDGFINYGGSQLARYARPPVQTAARAPYYTANAFKPSDINGNVDKRNADEMNEDDEVDEDDEEDARDNYDEEDSGEEEADKDHVTENREKAVVDSGVSDPIHGLANPRPNIDVSLEFGEEYSAARNFAHGEKSDKGYNKRVEFDVGERGRHDKSSRREHYDAETRNKKGYSDVAGNYGHYGEVEGGERSSSYGQTSYHNKGQKTSGFHKVYRKNEYKKHTDFYDESHKKGYFDKHVAADEYHDAAEGGFRKGGRHNSGFDHETSGKEGFYDKGHVENRDQGYMAEKGEDSFHSDYENYDSDKDTQLIKKHKKPDTRHQVS